MEIYVLLALVCMTLFGVNAIIYKLAPNIDPVSLTLVSFVTSALGTFIYWVFFVSKKQLGMQGIGYGIIGGLISVAALITFISALQLGKASVVNTIRALSAAVTVVLAILFLSEKLTLVKGVGIGLAVVAAVLLSI
ncbi:EamA family transporter [Candidatus Woesearchaeota archaeon]|nr:EamA family transporter [Candidatus Woesearchaeota archaeon]